MEQFRVPRLLAGALAAVTGAVVASFFGVEGTLIGAALGSILVTPAEAVYTRTLASADTLARRSLLRRVGEGADPSEEGASKARPEPIRWRRVAVAAVLAFGIAVGAITGMEAVAQQPLASLFGSRPRQGASTSVGVVVAEADRPAPPASRAPAMSTTSPSRSAPTTTVAVPTTTAPVAVPTTTAPAGTVPNATAAATTTSSSHTPTTGTP
jgi:cytoskeletal protein RodZ